LQAEQTVFIKSMTLQAKAQAQRELQICFIPPIHHGLVQKDTSIGRLPSATRQA
jgi:hypothetical protein